MYLFCVLSRYNIERPHESIYDVDLDLSVCWQGRCNDPIVVLQDAMFSASHCGQEGSSKRRKRRSVDDLYVNWMEVDKADCSLFDLPLSLIRLPSFVTSHYKCL